MFTLAQRKKLFAERYLANPQEVYQAGVAAWPDDPREGLMIATVWPHDPEVQRYCNELHANGASINVPSRETIIQEVLDLGRTAANAELAERLKAYELAAKMMGYIAPPQTNVNNKTTLVNNRVMVVKDHGDANEWERKAKEQQKRLISNHDVSNPTKH